MLEITDNLVINLEYISSVSTQVDKFNSIVTPWLTLSMTNGDKHNVSGLKDIYLFLDNPAVNKRRTWNSLVSKIKSYLEKDDSILSEEDREYLTRKI